MQPLIEELDRTHARVREARADTLGRLETLVGELVAAKANIQREVRYLALKFH